jgi:DNA-binding Lrp family transcriptional regulator
MERDRVTVQEAAQRLGISESGVRKRVKREQLDSTHEGGRVYVYLDSVGQDADSVPDSVPDKYVSSLEDQVEFLRGELQRKDAILLNMTESIKALGAPEEPVQEEEPPEDTGGPGVSILRRLFRRWP